MSRDAAREAPSVHHGTASGSTLPWLNASWVTSAYSAPAPSAAAPPLIGPRVLTASGATLPRRTAITNASHLLTVGSGLSLSAVQIALAWISAPAIGFPPAD